MKAADVVPITTEVIAGLDATIALFTRAVAPMRHFLRIRGNVTNDLQLVAGLHALAVRDELRAAAAIAREGLAYQLAIHARTIFEATTRVQWMYALPERATAFLQSEPFERYWLAKTYPRIRERLAYDEVTLACEDAIRHNPSLAELGKSTAAKPDYLAIRAALKVPSMGVMLKDMNEDVNAYAERYHVPSIAGHASVAYMRNFHLGNNPDGTAVVGTTPPAGALEAWIIDMMRTVPYLLATTISLRGIVRDDVERFVAFFNTLAEHAVGVYQSTIDASLSLRLRVPEVSS